MDVTITPANTEFEVGTLAVNAIVNTTKTDINITNGGIELAVNNQPMALQINAPNVAASVSAGQITTIIIGTPGTSGETPEEPINLTSNTTLAENATRKLYNNLGATNLVEVTFATPEAQANSFTNLTEFGLKLKAPDGVKLKLGNTESEAGGFVQTTASGAFISFVAMTPTLYLARYFTSDWEVN